MFRALSRCRTGWLGAAMAGCVCEKLSHCTISKHDAVEYRRTEDAQQQQYAEALLWCVTEEKQSYAADNRKDVDGNKFCTLINRSGLQRRIDGEVDNTDPFAHNRTVTVREEADLVEVCKELNRHGQGVDRAHLGAMVIDSLRLRTTLNRGRDYTPLSHNTKEMLAAVHKGVYKSVHTGVHKGVHEGLHEGVPLSRGRGATQGRHGCPGDAGV